MGVKQVKTKVENSARNEWDKVKLVQNFKPEYRTIRSGTVPIINSIKSVFWQAADNKLKMIRNRINSQQIVSQV